MSRQAAGPRQGRSSAKLSVRSDAGKRGTRLEKMTEWLRIQPLWGRELGVDLDHLGDDRTDRWPALDCGRRPHTWYRSIQDLLTHSECSGKPWWTRDGKRPSRDPSSGDPAAEDRETGRMKHVYTELGSFGIPFLTEVASDD
ncbi:hypothetical protein E5288_WYG001022 [Bos mutus]|uniref:Uncharacterized protein n=1 Tax=Bos mutus TaxID=72004 RepID=A0A6B0RXC5_9CETA|nr:hypothetical protein [Bos mutus]